MESVYVLTRRTKWREMTRFWGIFTWVLGLRLTRAFGVRNAMWFELDADKQASKRPADERNLP
jgi:cyd operon protein YbgT